MGTDDRGLGAVLARHIPRDAVEARHLEACRALVGEVQAPTSRSTFEPGHVTASAFVLSPDLERLLLIHHGTLGLWLQPGGHVEPADRDVFAAAEREVREETGLRRVHRVIGRPELLDVDVHEIPANPRKGEPAHRHFDLRVLMVAEEETLQAGDDALDARWVPLDSLDAMETDASVRRAVQSVQAWRARVRGTTPQIAPAAERNAPVLQEVLAARLPDDARLLEIGCGTGQHAAQLAPKLAVRWWWPTDRTVDGLDSAWAWRLRGDGARARLRPPVRLDVEEHPWSVPAVDAVLAVNVVHISPWSTTEALLRGAADVLVPGGALFLYGPYRRSGVPTAPSNEQFDRWLRARDPSHGLRAVEDLEAVGRTCGLVLEEVVEVPARNLVLVFRAQG